MVIAMSRFFALYRRTAQAKGCVDHNLDIHDIDHTVAIQIVDRRYYPQSFVDNELRSDFSPYIAVQPKPRAALITIWTSTTLTTPSPFKSLTAGIIPRASLIMSCTSATLVTPSPLMLHFEASRSWREMMCPALSYW